MPNASTLKITQKTHDASLFYVITEIKIIQNMLFNIYGRILGISSEEANKDLTEMRKTALEETYNLLAHHGDLEVPGLLKSLGL